ncbi:metallophosphoesterase [Pseudarthrobacter sp. PS3-L1]|uniref:metallophosphoesterase n=1 Tax=Pseudarthrobacter sp. PS3-L1 TaxID=3046207 RepID=UPI0024B97ACD|nr:metallophosphoesterase [Pseudarthrobacter sp. PS3-L1]MDJ0319193.1 metallophosphoesterase [Pseudarthrobacter sp. PS3-L1]
MRYSAPDFSGLAKRARTVGRNAAFVAGTGAAVGSAAFGYGLWEKNQFGVREENLAILPPGQQPFRILHLSDIHFVPGQHKKAAWLSSLADLRPDLVVNTGDNLSHVKAVDPLLEALKPLFEFPGVFVPGSNDYYGPSWKNPASYLFGPSLRKKEPVPLDWTKLSTEFGLGGWIDLTNRHQSLVMNRMRFDFSGVDDPHLQREKYAGWPRGTSGQDQTPHLKVAVIHAPYQRVLDHFTRDEADLLLAGHTHGGQICVPGFGALVTNCDLPTWRAKGLHTWESKGHTTPVNVSGGIGTSRYAPIRIACRPEAVLLTLTERTSAEA